VREWRGKMIQFLTYDFDAKRVVERQMDFASLLLFVV
jgi:hypothetical protein